MKKELIGHDAYTDALFVRGTIDRFSAYADNMLPKGWEHIFIVYPFGDNKNNKNAYCVSTARRKEVLKVLSNILQYAQSTELSDEAEE